MEKRRLGNTDMEVSLLGFGGAEIGAQEIAQETVTQLLNSALDAGLNVIDTASAYWKSELMIGNAVSHRRKEFYLLTKCGATDGFTRYDWSKSGILSQIERSLKNLKTDYLDLIQLHSCVIAELKKGEAIEALRLAREKGYSRYIGYSGDSQAAKYAIETGAFDTLQTSISIADQEAIELTLPLAQTRGMGVIAKRPVANAAWRTGQKPADSYHYTYWDRLKKLDYDFLNSGLQNSISIALRFTLSQDSVATAIVGTTNPGRWRENAELLAEGPLDAAEVAKIRARWMQVAKSGWIGQV
ncbi:MAG: aldo/keto reductase [Acidobacteria bacterium]|nr:aldo/keto reductase [Acidobacteriota bacterium]